MSDDTYWYRYEAQREGTGYHDYSGEFILTGSVQRVVCLRYKVIRHTPKGVWLSLGFGGKRFVLDGTRKQFAHSTEKDALTSFLHRKQRHLNILEAQVDGVKEAMLTAEKMLNNFDQRESLSCPSTSFGSLIV